MESFFTMFVGLLTDYRLPTGRLPQDAFNACPPHSSHGREKEAERDG